MASWSLLAIRAASERATPNNRDQTKRRLTALPHCRGCFRGIACGQAVRQFGHHPRPFGRTHTCPLRDLINRPAAAEAETRAGIKSADFDARRLDWVLDHGFAWDESGATLSIASGKAIA